MKNNIISWEEFVQLFTPCLPANQRNYLLNSSDTVRYDDSLPRELLLTTTQPPQQQDNSGNKNKLTQDKKDTSSLGNRKDIKAPSNQKKYHEYL